MGEGPWGLEIALSDNPQDPERKKGAQTSTLFDLVGRQATNTGRSLPVMAWYAPLQQGSNNQTDDGHDVDENVHGRSGGILERVTHGVTNYGCVMGV